MCFFVLLSNISGSNWHNFPSLAFSSSLFSLSRSHSFWLMKHTRASWGDRCRVKYESYSVHRRIISQRKLIISVIFGGPEWQWVISRRDREQQRGQCVGVCAHGRLRRNKCTFVQVLPYYEDKVEVQLYPWCMHLHKMLIVYVYGLDSQNMAALIWQLRGRKWRRTGGKDKHRLFIQAAESHWLVWKEQVWMDEWMEGGKELIWIVVGDKKTKTKPKGPVDTSSEMKWQYTVLLLAPLSFPYQLQPSMKTY